MKHKFHLLLLVAVLLLLVAVPLTAQDGGMPEPVGIRPDAPQYALHGPYWVGTQDFMIEDETRPLPVTVWYPAMNPEGVDESTTYVVDYPPMINQLPIAGHAILDATPDIDSGPYPLVVFSHGAFGWRYSSLSYIEHLASYGFVVISADHVGDTPANMSEEDAFLRSHVTRPQDVACEIDFAEALTGTNGTLAGLINMESVAVSGHSSGGWTALLASGAQRDYDALNAWCADYADDIWTCGNLLGQEAALSDILGLDGVPTGLWPSVSDPRVDAMILFAPGNGPAFGPNGLATVTVPAMVLSGSSDAFLPFDLYAEPTYRNLGSTQKSFVILDDGGHTIFADSCNRAPWMVDFGFYFLCSDPVWDMDRAHDLINHFTTAFLLAELYDDTDAAAALSAENARFTGITYESTEF